MPRKPTPDQQSQDDSATLHEAVQSIIDGMGHGGLSYVAERIGMTPSALRKRLLVPGKAFDAPTVRASLLVLELNQQPAEELETPEAPEQASSTREPEPQ